MNKKINSKTFIGCLCALGCEILFGLSYAFAKQAMESTGAFELLGWRFFCGVCSNDNVSYCWHYKN